MASNSSPANVLSPEHLILGLLRQAPAHGYELQQRIARDLSELWHLQFNQIYGILHRLEAEGRIVGTVEKGNSAPARRRYRITRAGDEHFMTWLRKPTVSSVRVIRIEFITRLFFARQQCPELMTALLTEQKDATRRSLMVQQGTLEEAGVDRPFSQLGIALRVRTLAGVLDWLEDCATTLEGPSNQAADDTVPNPHAE